MYVYIIQTCEGEKDRQENGVCVRVSSERMHLLQTLCVCVCVFV